MSASSYEQALGALALADGEIVVLTAENRAPIRGLPDLLGPRFIDVGIAEQTLVGAAAGLALRGRKPVVHALASFLTMRAFEFIRTDVGLPGLPVTLVGYLPGLLSEANGPTHQAIEDVALMRLIPGMNVFCPADEEELVLGLPAVLASGCPTYVRFNGRPAEVRHPASFEIGRAEVLSEGGDVTLLSYGFLLGSAEAARARLEADGYRVRLVNLRMLEPVDEAAILDSARETPLLFTIEDHLERGGLYSIVSEVLARHRVRARVQSFSLQDRCFTPALLPAALTHCGLDGATLASRVRSALQEK